MIGLECKEAQRLPARLRSNDKPPRKTASLASALAVILPSRPTELHTQQKAPGDSKADGLLCVHRG
jgi:hypothetical protein